MNTKNKQDQTNHRQKSRQKQRPKKQGQSPHMLHEDLKHHEQEQPETRMTR
jgi:hypothetical protein